MHENDFEKMLAGEREKIRQAAYEKDRKKVEVEERRMNQPHVAMIEGTREDLEKVPKFKAVLAQIESPLFKSAFSHIWNHTLYLTKGFEAYGASIAPKTRMIPFSLADVRVFLRSSESSPQGFSIKLDHIRGMGNVVMDFVWEGDHLQIEMRYQQGMTHIKRFNSLEEIYAKIAYHVVRGNRDFFE